MVKLSGLKNKTKMKPSNFTSHPWESVLQNNTSETVAHNIMIILKRTGDKWRHLSWEEYESERKKDGNFSIKENAHFNKVINYCKSSESAQLFSPTWKNL